MNELKLKKEYFSQAFTLDRLLQATRTQIHDLQERCAFWGKLSHEIHRPSPERTADIEACLYMLTELKQTYIKDEAAQNCYDREIY